MTQGHATPRLAASIILSRRRGQTVEVLMGQRRVDARFMPNMRVFPGGAVDAGDLEAGSSDTLAPRLAKLDAEKALPAPAHALVRAALRETEEETGFAFRCPRRGDYDLARCELIARAVTPVHLPIRFDTFFFHAEADHLDTEAGLRDSDELLNVGWYDLSCARKGAVHRITAYMLDHFASWLETPHQERKIPYLRPTRTQIPLDFL